MARAVFLDRDGVLNAVIMRGDTPTPPTSLADFRLLPGVAEALNKLHAAAFKLIVVTNQPDIARGAVSAGNVDIINTELRRLLPQLTSIDVCPHDDRDHCVCRKPKPGLLLAAAARENIELTKSYMIGDRWRDINAGKSAGCTTILVGPGYKEGLKEAPDQRYSALPEAAEWILRHARSTV